MSTGITQKMPNKHSKWLPYLWALLVLVIGGGGYLYGGVFGAVIFSVLRDWLSVITPQYWMFWIGLILIIIVFVGRERLGRWRTYLPGAAGRLKAKAQAAEDAS